jgi:Domain of unknown function (DUF1833)
MNDRVLETLQISHPLFSATHFITNSDEGFKAVDENGLQLTFLPFPFQVKLPSSGENGFQDLVLSISNVSPLLVQEIERARGDTRYPIRFVYRAYAESNLNAVGWSLPPLSSSEIVVEKNVISAQASMADLVNRNFPNQLYTTTLFPMLARV